MKTLAEKILDYRAKNNLTQKEFAELAGVSFISISHIEHGYQPKPVTQIKIENVLKGSLKNEK